LPALTAAWDLAAAAPDSAVLWIHGPQSVLLDAGDGLRQRMERRKNGPRIYTYAAIGGENRLLASLADLPNFKAVPRFTPGTGIWRTSWHPRRARRADRRGAHARDRRPSRRARRHRNVGPSRAPVGVRPHRRADAPGVGRGAGPAQRKEALALAARYHLVTAVSGAVVLESQADTDAVAGSDAERASVPTVPEPETWALLGWWACC
jgi:hypothetical protein